MTWLPPEHSASENPANLESALIDLKGQLEKINEEIKIARIARDELLSGNNKFINEKISELEAKIKDAEDLKAKAADLQSTGAAQQELLMQEQARHSNDVAANDERKVKFLDEVRRNAEALDQQADEVKKLRAVNEENGKFLDKREADINEAMTRALEKHKELEAMLEAIKKSSETLNTFIDEKRKLIVESEDLEKRISYLREQNEKMLSDAQSERQANQDILAKNVAILSEIEKQKEINMNLVIEGRKLASSNADKFANLTKKEIDVNTKIADLQALQQSISK